MIDSYPKNSVWKLRSFQILNKVISILNLDTPQKNKIAEILSRGTRAILLLAMAMPFQQIIALPSHAQISV